MTPKIAARMCAVVLAGSAIAAAAQGASTAPARTAVPSATSKSNWEEEQEKLNWQEREAQLPPFPSDASLIEFSVSSGTTFRFFIDAASIGIFGDGVVRYTLVARSPSGVSNISYEGIRCSNKSYKVFAQGIGGKWSPRETEWREIQPRTIQRWHNALYYEYLCPHNVAIQSAAEGVDALRRGGHPMREIPQYGGSR